MYNERERDVWRDMQGVTTRIREGQDCRLQNVIESVYSVPSSGFLLLPSPNKLVRRLFLALFFSDESVTAITQRVIMMRRRAQQRWVLVAACDVRE